MMIIFDDDDADDDDDDDGGGIRGVAYGKYRAITQSLSADTVHSSGFPLSD